MEVELINWTGWLPPTLWTALRTCKSEKTPSGLWSEAATYWDSSAKQDLILRVLKSGHLSIAEHCALTFAISGVSRSLLAQVTRHRIGISFSVQSQRSVEGKNLEEVAVVPPSISANPDALTVFNECMSEIQNAYEKLRLFNIPREDARYVYPNAAPTNYVTTVNLRSLYDLYTKRVLTPGAQWEIKEMVTRMVDDLLQVEPWLTSWFKGEE